MPAFILILTWNAVIRLDTLIIIIDISILTAVFHLDRSQESQ